MTVTAQNCCSQNSNENNNNKHLTALIFTIKKSNNFAFVNDVLLLDSADT